MIAFNEIPSNVRAPFTYIEFDSSRAVSGPSAKAYKALLIGQKKVAGRATSLETYRITSDEQAAELFGRGSMLALMVKKFRANNKSTEMHCVAVDDLVAGVCATGAIKISGIATKAGILYAYIAGQAIKVGVASGDTAQVVASKLKAQMDLALDLPVSGAVDGVDQTKVNLTFVHKGVVGNFTDIRINYYDGEMTPEGLSAEITNFSGGAGNPELANLVAALPETQYEFIGSPYTDDENVTALNNMMANRWGPTMQATGIVYSAIIGTHSEIGTYGDGKNSKAYCVFENHKYASTVFESLAAKMAVVAFSISLDQARPLQTLEVVGLLPASKKDRFTMEERNLLLFDGISTCIADDFGALKLERVITTYKKNAAGADDVAYLDVTTVYTLDYLRYDLKNTILRKYPRHKLADDNISVIPPNTITPKIAIAEAINIFKGWEEKGLVENFDAFKEGIIVERDITDRNRLNWVLTPDLMNQLMINGIQISFIL